MNDQPELLPCPFCGKDPSVKSVGMGGNIIWYGVMCHVGCCAQSAPCETEEQAAEAWNTRPAPAVTVKPMSLEDFWTYEVDNRVCEIIWSKTGGNDVEGAARIANAVKDYLFALSPQPTQETPNE